MKQLIALLCVISLVACATSAFTPKEFASRLHQQGAAQTLKQISPTEWQELIAGVSKGDKAWLDLVPQFAENIYYLNDWQKTRELSRALAFALVNNPEETLIMMQPIDRRIEALGDDGAPLVDFGSMMACAIPLLVDYDRDSVMRYHQTLTARLKKTGKLGEQCLNSVNGFMEEILADEARGNLNWSSTKIWYP